MTSTPATPRCAAIVGPYLSGKTTLMESLLFASGATHRKGSVKEKNTVGDPSPEAKDREMSVEVSAAAAEFLGDPWTFLDCPGSIEFAQETFNALMVADAAVVVCEPLVERALTVAPLLKFLDDHQIPHILFINKLDTATSRVREVIEALQGVSERPLVVRHMPIREGEGISGYVDLVSERAYRYKPGEPSELVTIPDSLMDREQAERTEMLESLADFDDALLEQLLEDVVPPKEEIYRQLTKVLQEDLVVPVLLGAAEQDHGVRRLLKALRHEVPDPEETAKRRGLELGNDTLAHVFKTYHAPHTGKLSLARIWRGPVRDGMTLDGIRVSGLFRMMGGQQNKIAEADTGEVVGLGRMDEVRTGDMLTPSGRRPSPNWPPPLSPLYSMAIHAEKRADEVKLSTALARLAEEDPSISFEQNPDTGELLLWGQGEMQLQITLDRLRNKYHVPVTSHRPDTPYRETIRKGVAQHARYKRQTGGHGQFGDVHVEVRPLPRGAGFEFTNKIVGGAIPRQYIPAVEAGVREYMERGPLGFPVVDVAVTLTDGSYHSVDSSEQAFKTAGRMAMSEALPKCDPVLLEPIYQVTISVPSDFTPKLQRLVSSRRGQILGFDAKQGWKGWDELTCYMPQAEMHDLIIELRSLTIGVGHFAWTFDHLQELSGRIADQIVEQRAAAS